MYFKSNNNPWAPGGAMHNQSPWSQRGMEYGWGQSSGFFKPKSKEEIREEALVQLAVLAVIVAAPALAGAAGSGSAVGVSGTAAEAGGMIESAAMQSAVAAPASGLGLGHLSAVLLAPFLASFGRDRISAAVQGGPEELSRSLHQASPSWVFDSGRDENNVIVTEGQPHPGIGLVEEAAKTLARQPRIASALKLMQAGKRGLRDKEKSELEGLMRSALDRSISHLAKKTMTPHGSRFLISAIEHSEWAGNNSRFDEEEINHKKVSSTQTLAIGFYGGARRISDNSAFKIAVKNTQSSYGNVYKNVRLFASSGKYIVDTINGLDEAVIGRLDIATHGSGTAIYMVRHSSYKRSGEFQDIPIDDVESNNLYTNWTARFLESWWNGPLEATLGDIDYSRFSNDAVVEFHGCRVGADVNTAYFSLLADNIAENFSEGLFAAGNLQAVVIAHFTKANPSINGPTTMVNDQDYRHGKRVVYHNGEVLFFTSRKGHIGKDAILKYVAMKTKGGGGYDGLKENY